MPDINALLSSRLAGSNVYAAPGIALPATLERNVSPARGPALTVTNTRPTESGSATFKTSFSWPSINPGGAFIASLESPVGEYQ